MNILDIVYLHLTFTINKLINNKIHKIVSQSFGFQRKMSKGGIKFKIYNKLLTTKDHANI